MASMTVECINMYKNMLYEVSSDMRGIYMYDDVSVRHSLQLWLLFVETVDGHLEQACCHGNGLYPLSRLSRVHSHSDVWLLLPSAFPHVRRRWL